MTEDPEFGFVERYVSPESTLVEHPMAAGILGAPTHTHSREDELSYVVYGRVQAQVGDRLISAGPQEIIWKPRRVPHAFWNPGPDRALILERRAIVTARLSKRFGRVRAVTDLSLKVRAGEIVGFLGPNGAGKTTTIRMLMGFINPTSGHCLVLGGSL